MHETIIIIVTVLGGHCLATKVFIGKLPATKGVWVIEYRLIMKGGYKG